MARDAATVAKRWSTNLGASTEKIREGVQAVRVSPGTAAAAQADVWVQNTTAAKEKFRRNVSRVTITDWQDAMLNKGLNRIGTGATAAEAKMEQFMGKLLAFHESARGSLPPRGNLEANIQRAVAWIRKMATFSAA